MYRAGARGAGGWGDAWGEGRGGEDCQAGAGAGVGRSCHHRHGVLL